MCPNHFEWSSIISPKIVLVAKQDTPSFDYSPQLYQYTEPHFHTDFHYRERKIHKMSQNGCHHNHSDMYYHDH